MAPEPNIPSIDQVIQNLKDLPKIIDNPAFTTMINPLFGGLLQKSTNPTDVTKRPASGITADTFYNGKYSHEDLCNMVNKISLDNIGTAKNAWTTVFTQLQAGFEAFDDSINKAIGEKWHGASGDKAVSAIGTYANDSLKLVEAAQMVGQQLASLHEVMQQTQRSMPQVPVHTAPQNFLGWLPGVDFDHERFDNAWQQAGQFLTKVYYGGGVQTTDQNLPVFPAVQDPTNTSQGNGPGSNPGGSGPSGLPGTNSPSNPDDPNKQSPNQQSPSQTTDQSGQNNSSGNSNNGKSTGDGQSAHASDAGGPQTTASGFDPSGGLGGGGGGADTALSAPSLGAGTTGNNSGSTAAGAHAGGAAGAAGMPGLGGAGKGGKKEEDKEHKSADYLRGQHLQQWLNGDIDKLSPAVLGFDENGNKLA